MPRRRSEQWLVALPAAFAFGLLVFRLARDVHGKPLIEDEAVAGLIGARPLGELLGIVLSDRGAAPLHFLLVHVVLALDSSASALRWLSVAFAIGAVLLCAELGRRLGGPVAGAAAGIAGATSGLLTIYGNRCPDVRALRVRRWARGRALRARARAADRRGGVHGCARRLAAPGGASVWRHRRCGRGGDRAVPLARPSPAAGAPGARGWGRDASVRLRRPAAGPPLRRRWAGSLARGAG